jgi:hypothetical protein
MIARQNIYRGGDFKDTGFINTVDYDAKKIVN